MIQDPLSLEARSVLVIAPHPDDESLGCGGLLASFARDGRRTRVVFVTDGGASHPGSKLWPRSRLVEQRRTEAIAALASLGVAAGDAEFLGLPDSDMPSVGSTAADDAVRRLRTILSHDEPDLVLLPWRRDPHRDHRDAWTLSQAALSEAAAAASTLEYAIWLDELGRPEDVPLPGEMDRVELDVSAVLPEKRAAIAAHLSQTTRLISDDPGGFMLSPHTINRLAGPIEIYWRPCA